MKENTKSIKDTKDKRKKDSKGKNKDFSKKDTKENTKPSPKKKDKKKEEHSPKDKVKAGSKNQQTEKQRAYTPDKEQSTRTHRTTNSSDVLKEEMQQKGKASETLVKNRPAEKLDSHAKPYAQDAGKGEDKRIAWEKRNEENTEQEWKGKPITKRQGLPKETQQGRGRSAGADGAPSSQMGTRGVRQKKPAVGYGEKADETNERGENSKDRFPQESGDIWQDEDDPPSKGEDSLATYKEGAKALAAESVGEDERQVEIAPDEAMNPKDATAGELATEKTRVAKAITSVFNGGKKVPSPKVQKESREGFARNKAGYALVQEAGEYTEGSGGREPVHEGATDSGDLAKLKDAAGEVSEDKAASGKGRPSTNGASYEDARKQETPKKAQETQEEGSIVGSAETSIHTRAAAQESAADAGELDGAPASARELGGTPLTREDIREDDKAGKPHTAGDGGISRTSRKPAPRTRKAQSLKASPSRATLAAVDAHTENKAKATGQTEVGNVLVENAGDGISLAETTRPDEASDAKVVRLSLGGELAAGTQEAAALSAWGTSKSVLRVSSLYKSFGRKSVVKGVDFSMTTGEVLGLLGPNGAGKTTTFYMIVGFYKPTSGDVFLDAKCSTHLPMYKRARAGISYLPQESSVFRKLTVEENIWAILETRKDLTRAQKKQKLNELIDEFAIGRIRKQQAYTLSGGERRRTEIARSLAIEPKFLLLDEPFAGIDPIAVADIKSMIRLLSKRGIGILITDHNVRDTLEITDRAIIISTGTILVAGGKEDILKSDEAREIYLGKDFSM